MYRWRLVKIQEITNSSSSVCFFLRLLLFFLFFFFFKTEQMFLVELPRTFVQCCFTSTDLHEPWASSLHTHTLQGSVSQPDTDKADPCTLDPRRSVDRSHCAEQLLKTLHAPVGCWLTETDVGWTLPADYLLQRPVTSPRPVTPSQALRRVTEWWPMHEQFSAARLFKGGRTYLEMLVNTVCD